MRKGHTGKRERPALHHGAVGIVSLLLLCLTLGNWFFVLHPLGNKRLPETKGNGVPDWLPALQQQPQRSYPAVQWLGRQQHKSTSQSMAYSSSRRDDVMPAEFQTHISNNLRRESVVRDYRRFGEKQRPPTRHGSWRSSRGGTSSRGRGSNSRAAAKNHAWGKGMTVLIFTVDSLTDVVAKSKTGGPAGEIIVRESLTTALTEAGVQVELAVSDIDFERRADVMDVYSAVILDAWTWAGKDWRLKRQLVGQQNKIFILDFFGAGKPHANLGVPLAQYLTAFPVPPSQRNTFLGYGVESSQGKAPSSRKRQQGVIWGKTAASFQRLSARNLVYRLADLVELHSTVAPEDASVRHENIVYHGHLSKKEWHRLLRDSKFFIGLGDPLSGPSAIDAVVAGCVYLNPVFSRPVMNIYNSQHPFLARSVGEPYVCSYEQEDTEAAVGCALKALEQDLPPLVPQELTKESHETRVRRIFEPLAMMEDQ